MNGSQIFTEKSFLILFFESFFFPFHFCFSADFFFPGYFFFPIVGGVFISVEEFLFFKKKMKVKSGNDL